MEKTDRQMSPFCEGLMEATASLSDIQAPADCALILCTDGHTVSKRICGSPLQMTEMLYASMLNDQTLAVCMHEAVMRWRRVAIDAERRLLKVVVPEVPDDGIIQ